MISQINNEIEYSSDLTNKYGDGGAARCISSPLRNLLNELAYGRNAVDVEKKRRVRAPLVRFPSQSVAGWL